MIRTRLMALVTGTTLLALAACGGGGGGGSASSTDRPPILFVHGNGDSSALWITTIWRFESSGYPRDRLFAIDFPAPTARDDNAVAQTNRSSTDEQRQQLAARVDEVLAKTGARKLALVGNSRGGYSIRNYIRNGGGAAKVGWAVLGGAPNHGVYAIPGNNSEFNGAASFLKQLNDAGEVVPGVKFLAIRSDRLDKFAQPELSPGRSSGIGYDGPELKGATNVVLEGVDHRETSFSARAFAETYRFITGQPAARTAIVPETQPRLSGVVGGFENKAPTNRGVAGVRVSIYEVDPSTGARRGAPVHEATTGGDGSWGAFTARPSANYEFVVQAPGQPVRHFFRSPFPRSSSIVGLRLFEDAPSATRAVVVFTRPRGYVSNSRDKHSLDGKPVPGVLDGVPTASAFRVEMDGPERAVPVSLNGEAMTVRAIPGEIVYAEFHY